MCEVKSQADIARGYPTRDTRTDGMALYRERMRRFHSAQQIGSERSVYPRSAEDLKWYGPWWKAALATALLVLLTGCSQLSIVKDQAAGIADGSLEASVYGACVASSVGALVRRYGSDPDGRAAWELYCSHEWRRGSGEFALPEIK